MCVTTRTDDYRTQPGKQRKRITELDEKQIARKECLSRKTAEPQKTSISQRIYLAKRVYLAKKDFQC